MDDVMFRIRAQFVERIIWIVIILILLIALVVVSVYKTETCAPETEPVTEEEPAATPEPEPTPAPVTTPKPTPTPTPTPEPTTTTGKISFSVERLDCQPMSAAGNLTRAKINSIGMTIENGKSTPLVAEMSIYIWDIAHEDEKDIARTGEVPVRIGSIAAGKKFNDFVNVRNKPTTFVDVDRDHTLKLEILDETDKIVATKQLKFKMVGSTCQMV